MNIKNNKLIAEFMDFYKTCCVAQINSNLKYHSSWDWLMPVVEKIESTQKLYVEISERDCKILNINFDYPIVESRCSTKIKAVYKTVVEFIKFYNKNK